MKNIRLFAFLCTAIILGLGFTGCKKETVPVFNDADLVGKWMFTHAMGYEKYPGAPEMDDEWEEDMTAYGDYIVMKADHSFEAVSHDPTNGKSETITGKWGVASTALIFRDRDGDVLEELSGTIKTLTGDTLQIEISEKRTGEYGSYTYYVCGTFTKQQ